MSEKLVMVLFNGIILWIILISQLFSVKVSKENILLGIKIPEDKIGSDEVKDIIKGFKKENLMTGIPTLTIISLIIYFIDSIRFSIISIFLYIGILFLIYLGWHKKVNELNRRRWQKLGRKNLSMEQEFSRNQVNPGSVSQKSFLVPLSIILINMVVGLAIYRILPDKLPIYWDQQGNIDAYMTKSIYVVLLMPMMQLFLAFVIYLSYFAMNKAKHHVNPRDPKRSLRKNIIFRKVWSVYFIVTLTLVEILLTILNMMTLGILTNIKLFNIFSFSITGFIVVGAITLGIIMGQGGDRLKLRDDCINDDRFWKLGNTIYFNPEDPTIFMGKRTGVGWTVNVGRPSGIILMSFPIIIVIVALIFAG